MAFNVKDLETEKLAAEVAALAGEQEVWPQVPRRPLGKRVTRREREAILRIPPRGRVIVDSSAIIAILLREPGWEDLFVKLGAQTATALHVASVMAVTAAGFSSDERSPASLPR